MGVVDVDAGLVVIERPAVRREHEEDVGAGGFGGLGLAGSLQARFGVDAGADQTGGRSGGSADLDDAPLLRSRQHKVLARVAVDQQPPDARRFGDGRDVPLQGGLVDAPVIRHRHDSRRVDAAELSADTIHHAAPLTGSGEASRRSIGKSGIAGSRPRIRSARSRAM
jgi:hypothetical protein